VDSYDNPLIALEKFKADLYNLVILDIKMPELNGFSLYREIKRLDTPISRKANQGLMGYKEIEATFSLSLSVNVPELKPVSLT
jgi:CheY-like chemotaxis protein